jgi:hypothetical protein
MLAATPCGELSLSSLSSHTASLASAHVRKEERRHDMRTRPMRIVALLVVLAASGRLNGARPERRKRLRCEIGQGALDAAPPACQPWARDEGTVTAEQNAALRAVAFEVELEPWPIPFSLVLACDPVASGRVLWRSDDGTRAIATYRCSPAASPGGSRMTDGRLPGGSRRGERRRPGRARSAAGGAGALQLRARERVGHSRDLLDYVVLYSPEGLRG